MTVATCGDCGAIFTRQDGHRCPTTVMDVADRIRGAALDGRVGELERLVDELRAENARWRAELGHA